MTPGAHLVLSWLCAVNVVENSRERRIISCVGLAPDLDGFGLVVDKLSGGRTYTKIFIITWGIAGWRQLLLPRLLLIWQAHSVCVFACCRCWFFIYIFCVILLAPRGWMVTSGPSIIFIRFILSTL